MALNPVDYSPAEIPILGRLIVPKAATPGIDFAGLLIRPATDSDLKAGQLVFGTPSGSPVAAGALSEYAATEISSMVAMPEGLDPVDASTIPVAGLTAYQSIMPHVKSGDKAFINGGLGGTGCFGIQIAKAIGCYVTTSRSTVNVEFCKNLRADWWVKEEKVKAVIDTKFKFEEAREAFERLKTGRSRGKVVVDVAGENYKGKTSFI